MKRLAVALFAISILFSCNTQDNKEKKDTGAAIEKGHETHGDGGSEGLSLNNGNKWKADANTNNNVKALLVVADELNVRKGKTLDNYHNAATGLQAGVEKMIKECRMQGADHAALHKWLEPLMKQVSAFQTSATEEQAEKEFHSIQKQLNLYKKYFE